MKTIRKNIMIKDCNMNKKIRILVCDPTYSPSVNRVAMILRIKYWQKKGLIVSILCSSEAEIFYRSHIKKITYYTFSFHWKAREYYSAIWDFLRANIYAFPLTLRVSYKFDIVFSLSSVLDIIFLPFIMKSINKNLRWYVRVDNTVPKPWERPGNLILKTVPYIAFLFSNILLKKCDGIIVVVNYLKKYYEQKGIKVIKTSDAYGFETEILKGKISSNTPKFNALFGGRLHPAKGIFDLVKIMQKICAQKKNFTLGIMGDGAYYHKDELLSKIKKANLDANIHLLGYKIGKQRGDLYRNCDFFLFPSYAEGLTIVVLEALAANKQVVAYDSPEYQDVFQKYIKTGQLKLFPKGDTDAIAKYVLTGKYLLRKYHNKLSDYSWRKNFKAEYEAFLGLNK